MYPDEDIADGLRIEYTALNEPFVAEALETTTGYASGTNIQFASAVIQDNDEQFGNTGTEFAQSDRIRVQGSASNDGDYTLTSSGVVNDEYLTLASGTFTTEDVGERVTITQIPLEVASASVDETSHANINQMLSLAIVDYVKAMKAESMGDLATKEYHIREFYSKLGDNETNKRKMSISFPTGPFAVR